MCVCVFVCLFFVFVLSCVCRGVFDLPDPVDLSLPFIIFQIAAEWNKLCKDIEENDKFGGEDDFLPIPSKLWCFSNDVHQARIDER